MKLIKTMFVTASMLAAATAFAAKPEINLGISGVGYGCVDGADEDGDGVPDIVYRSISATATWSGKGGKSIIVRYRVWAADDYLKGSDTAATLGDGSITETLDFTSLTEPPYDLEVSLLDKKFNVITGPVIHTIDPVDCSPPES